MMFLKNTVASRMGHPALLLFPVFAFLLVFASASFCAENEALSDLTGSAQVETTPSGETDAQLQTQPDADKTDDKEIGEQALEDSEETVNSAPDMEKSAADQAAYPGVINKSIVRKPADAPSCEIYYPVFGNAEVDAALKAFAERQADEYEKNVAEDLAPGEERPAAYGQWEMSGYFTLERPNPDIVTVIFNIFSYSGGAHGNLAITCLSYNLKTGKAVDFADLFKDPEKALEMMSAFSAEKLETELGEYADEDMIHSGTTPDLTNFSNLSLIPNGLYIEFQPYQVGPWAAGPQRVLMTLQDLAAAGPEADIWPRAADLPPPLPENQQNSDTVPDPASTPEQQ